MNQVKPYKLTAQQKMYYSFYDTNYDKKNNGIICPIYYGSNGPCFILFQSTNTGPRHDKLEFPGGTREPNESAADTAIRETFEETCEYLKISDSDISHAPFQKIWSSYCFYVSVPLMTNTAFQENIYNKLQEKNPKKEFLEMERLIRIPVDNFYKNGKLEFPRSDIMVKSVNGKIHKMWRLAALCCFYALQSKSSKSIVELLKLPNC